MPDRSERIRRLVHFAFGFCALLVPALGRGGSIAIAGTACLYNIFLAPAFGWDRAYRRKGESRLAGVGTYPVAVLLLLVLAPLHAAMAAWGVLAAADPAAAIVGTRWPRPRLPWNSRKSVSGSLAAFVVGAISAVLLLLHAGTPSPVGAAVVAGAAGAVAESLPWPMDDNIPVAAAAAVALAAMGV